MRDQALHAADKRVSADDHRPVGALASAPASLSAPPHIMAAWLTTKSIHHGQRTGVGKWLSSTSNSSDNPWVMNAGAHAALDFPPPRPMLLHNGGEAQQEKHHQQRQQRDITAKSRWPEGLSAHVGSTMGTGQGEVEYQARHAVGVKVKPSVSSRAQAVDDVNTMHMNDQHSQADGHHEHGVQLADKETRVGR